MTCLKVRDLYNYLEEGFSPERTKEVEEHLQDCRKCRRAVEVRKLIAEAASSLPAFEVPDGFPERVMSRLSRPEARKPVWLIALAAATSVFTLISVALVASGKSSLGFFASASQTFWDSTKTAAVLTAKLAAFVSLTGKTLRSLLETGTKGLSVLTSLLHPGFQVVIVILVLGILISLFYGMRKRLSVGD